MAYRDTILTDTPVDYYEMETSTGTDSGSGSRTLTLSGVTTGVAGRVVNGWSFNGTSNYASMASWPSLSTAYTFEGWVKAPSAQGMTGDYHTLIRRDGTDIVLLRVRGSNITGNVNPGQAEAYVAGTTLTSGTSFRVDDGNWHHIALTVSGTAATLYVDGVSRATATTSKSTYSMGTGAAYIGAASGTSEFFKGAMDEVAVYNTALSSTRIAAHYTAGNPVNVSYTASAMTGNGAMPTAIAIPVSPKTVSATVMTATASMPNSTEFTLITQGPGDDYSYSNASGTITADTTSLVIDSDNDSVMPFGPLPTGVVIDTATLKMFGDAGSMSIYPILAPWTGKPTSRGSYTLGTPINVTQASGSTTHNISALVSQGTVYGFLLTTTGGSMVFASGSNGTPANQPVLTFKYHSQIDNVVVTANAMTADATMPTAAVQIIPVLSPMTATASMPSATVIAQHDGGFIAEAMSADATMPGGQFSYSVAPTTTAMTASAASPAATASTTVGVVVNAGAMTGTAKWVPPSSVNGISIDQNENEDPYYNRVTALAPKYWWRFQDGGSVVRDTVTGATEGTPSGVYKGGAIANQATAPEGRKAVHFPLGGSIEQNEPFGSNTDETTFIGTNSVVRTVLEFSIKTNKANQFVMAGADQTVGANGVASNAGATELFVQNGKLGYRTYQYGTNAGNGTNVVTKEFVGFKTVADNEWHHITIRSGIKSGVRDEYGVEIWVDGKMDVRRYFTQSWIGMPDYIGNRPATFDSAVLPALPLSQNYEGDLAELVWYADTTHSEDDITRNYYAFFGYRPIDAPAMEASAAMTDAKGKGNQKKALYLYWTGQDEVFGGMPGKEGQRVEESISFDPMPELQNASTYTGSLYPGGEPLGEQTGEFFGYKVFTKSITRDKVNNTAYRDPVTDEQSLVNLSADVDLSEYDVIMFKDWPDEGYEIDWYEANYPGQRERLLQQLRDANEDGVALYVTNPRLAIDLGIIDRVEFVGPLTEHKVNAAQGRAAGLYDYGSALKFPWDIVGTDGLTGNPFATGIGVPANTDPSFLASKAYFYHDNNRNNKFRVRAIVNGLTDLPSYMLEDAVFHVDADQYGWEGAAYKYLHRENGLQIGDEYIFQGSPTLDPRWMDSIELRYLRTNGTWATPPGHVKAGLVVTTFGSTQYVNGQKTTNPYQDYATTIVLEQGTILNGRSTGGRIFVNFSETPSEGLDLPVQVLPGSPDDVENTLGVPVDDFVLDAGVPVFQSSGATLDQVSIINEVMERTTFPFNNLQNKINQRYGRLYIPIVFDDIDPGEGGFPKLALFDEKTGVITVDQAAIADKAIVSGQNVRDLTMASILRQMGRMIDKIYLQPYQRVNIWNVFHSDWNVFHNDNTAPYMLAQNFPLDKTTEDIKNGEGWTAPQPQFYTKNIGEAFGQAFVQAYSDIPIDTTMFANHPAPESIGPLIRAAIEVGQGAYLFQQGQVGTNWPVGYNPETPEQMQWEYSWTRTSLSVTAAALKTRTVKVTMPDGSIQEIEQGSTIKTRQNIPLSMVRSNQLFPVISKPRLEMTARGIYWLADAPRVAAGDAVVRATPMEANATAPSANTIAERSTVVVAQAMIGNAMMPESAQAKSGNASYIATPMTAEGRFSQGNERTVVVTPMTATGIMPAASTRSAGEEAITLRLPRPAKITLKIKEAV